MIISLYYYIEGSGYGLAVFCKHYTVHLKMFAHILFSLTLHSEIKEEVNIYFTFNYSSKLLWYAKFKWMQKL